MKDKRGAPGCRGSGSPLQTKDISETKRILYATAALVTEIQGIKPGKKKATNKPWWKR